MDTERNLLFGVVAFQSGAVDADGLAETCAVWTAEPTQPLADLMVDRGLMTMEQKTQVQQAVEHELASYGGDAHATLAATIDGRSIEAIGEAGGAGAMLDVGLPRRPEIEPGPSPGQGGHVVLGSLTQGEADARERYTLTHLHAKGGMGRVWLARDGALGRQIALKELRPDQSDNTIVCSRFLYEAKITAQLEHPGIVPVYELGEGEAPYYTMRFVRGRTLSEAIRAYHKKRAAGEADSVGLVDLLTSFVNVCHAVAYAHSRGIIHRDLKGQNVVLGDFGEVIVLDWGLAKRVGPDPSQASDLASDIEEPVADPLAPEAGTAVTCAALGARDDGMTLPENPDGATSAGSLSPDATDPGLPGPASGREHGFGSGSGSGHIVRPSTNDSAHPNGSAHSNGSAHARRSGIPESGAGPEGTMQGQLLGTPAYMAPEQAQARHDLVDQRTDIYGLGAILYEILTGRPPFVAPRTSEIIRKVVSEQATPPRQIVPEIAPGLEAVCLKAIRKDKAERYQSASDLAQEVRRHLADEPVQAFAEPWTLRAWRWVRHNRTKVAALAATLIVGIVALGFSTVLITGERNEAEAQGQQARQAVHLLTKGADIAFDDQLDPNQKERLQDALAYYEKFTGRAARDPAVRLDQGRAYQQMGDIERKLGKLEESDVAYRKAIATLEPLSGEAGSAREAKRTLARTRTLLADLLVRRGKDNGQANELYRQAAVAQTVLADAKKDPAATTEDVVRLGQTLKSQADLLRLNGKFSEARVAYGPAIDTLEQALAADGKHAEARNELALAIDARGLVEIELGDASAAETDYRRAVDLLEKLVAEFPTTARHREVLAGACSHLGWLEYEAGRLADAETHLRREVALDKRLVEDFADRTEYGRELARGLRKLGHVLQVQGQVAEGEPILRQSIEVNSAILAKSPDDVLNRFQLAMSHHDLGLVLMKQGNAQAALASFRAARAINEAMANQFRDKPRYKADLADNLDSIALALDAAGQPGADEAFIAADELYQSLVTDHPDNLEYRVHQAMSLRNRGAVLADAGKADRAEPILRRALALLDSRDAKAQSPDWQRTQAGVLINLGLLKRPGSEDALHRAIAICEKLLATTGGSTNDRYNLALAQNNLGDLLMHLRRLPEANTRFAEAAGQFEKLVAQAPKSMDFHHVYGIVLDGQGECLDLAGKTAEAKGVLTSAVEQQRLAVQLSKNAAVCRLKLAEHLIKLADVNRKLGAYDQAAKLALEVPKAVPTSARAQACFDAARALARLVAQLGGDTKVPQAERDHLTRVYLTRTVVLIRDAVDGNPELSKAIKADSDIKVLQSRPEFQAMMDTLVESGR